MAYLSEADELLYGGAAGGGKSALLVGLATTAHRKSIIFRREYPQLKGIVDYLNDVLGNSAKYNGSDHVFRLSGGKTIELGAVQHDDDVRKFQGRAHDLCAFDELTNFTEQQYRFLNNWKRTTVKNQKTRTVSASNPPIDAEGRWVVAYWAPWVDEKHPRPAKQGELRWFITYNNKDVEVDGPSPVRFKNEVITPKSRSFIHSDIDDNKYLIDTGYKAQLQALPDFLRRIMLDGDFGATITDSDQQVIPTAWVQAAQKRWVAMRKPDLPLTCIGVDVARGGADNTVLACRHGNWYDELIVKRGIETPDGQTVAQMVINALGGRKATVNIDVIGVGSSATDFLKDTVKDLIPVNFGTASSARDKSKLLKMINTRAEAYWSMREALDPTNGENIALPPDRLLLADLCAPTWKYQQGGVLLESKDDIKKRIGRSPDYGDAVVLAHYNKVRIGLGSY